ncbi:neuropeptide receptor 15 [Biomphalaria pfeifferi]|uniref:Neuropeptide receptor 15 n=1 Tax=Biomphalaria pfeifferi TaxID=112525 RepID=A0AAD8BST1_BIOPF|nr:neuropeptide receptor 15 [Biomphalaria pfeifferi]
MEKQSLKVIQEVLSKRLTIYISEKERRLAEICVDLTLSFITALVGSVNNLVVMVVLAKQGFKDSVSISMTTVAFWDFIKCFGGTLQRMSGLLALIDPAMAQSWANIGVVVFNYLVSFTSYVTSVLAAYVAIERCLCVTIPFRVKKLLTPKVASALCLAISVVVFGCFAVMYGVYDIYWDFDPEFNKTVAHYDFKDFSVNNTSLWEYYNISGVAWPTVSLIIIIICTVLISQRLQQASMFRNNLRNSTTSSSLDLSSNPGKRISRRDGQVIKMLLVVIALFIVTLSPRVAVYTAKYFVYDFYFLRRYHNLFCLVAYIVYFFDLLNGASNFFIFMVMSTSFRNTIKRMCNIRIETEVRHHTELKRLQRRQGNCY